LKFNNLAGIKDNKTLGTFSGGKKWMVEKDAEKTPETIRIRRRKRVFLVRVVLNMVKQKRLINKQFAKRKN